MPTYDYRCQDCGNRIEVVQSFSDAPLTVCNVCGGRFRRVFHPVGIVLKGSGFYSTDNRAVKRTAATTPKEDAKPAGGEKKTGGQTTGDAAKGKSKDDAGGSTGTKAS
jgi:putative FmdB family regulatory protein